MLPLSNAPGASSLARSLYGSCVSKGIRTPSRHVSNFRHVIPNGDFRGICNTSSTETPSPTISHSWPRTYEQSHTFGNHTFGSHPFKPKALFLDAAGTFLLPTEKVSDVYLRYGTPYGAVDDPEGVLTRFRNAYNDPWKTSIRYTGDARDFWRSIVTKSINLDDERAFEDIYQYYERSEAWMLAPGLEAAVTRVRGAGIKVCVVSNFDVRLRPLLDTLGVGTLFDEVVVSAEVGAEKPNPRIFRAACAQCGVDPDVDVVVHVGDDRRNDVSGARNCGIHAWLWGVDVFTFDEVADRVVSGDIYV